LVLPPKLAPIQVVIVPIFRNEDQLNAVTAKIEPLIKELRAKGISVKFDNRDTQTPGWKFAEYELKGVPVRLAVGPRDLDNNTVELARRDTKEKKVYSLDNLAGQIETLLEDMQRNIYQKALAFREANTTKVDDYGTFKEVLDGKGGFIAAHWDGTPETEEKIKDETKATIRCIPLDAPEEAGQCMYTSKPSNRRVLFARAIKVRLMRL
jgi:prolyl-tRNA synthetase